MARYKPLDLSFLSHHLNAGNGDQVRNTAQMIMANAGWSKPSQVTLSQIAAAQKKAKEQNASMHKQSFLSSVFDLLSTPLYGVANALDESLAGHQSDSNDSVLEDVGKSIGGIGTGFARGIGAGLRGATGILDVLPGVDISDDWQSNREDKTHVGDVMIRSIAGMSTKDALQPENLEEVKDAIKKFKAKGFGEKSPAQIALEPLIPDVDDPNFQAKYYRNMTLGSIPLDIGVDPLNAVSFPAKAAKAGTEITEGLDAARAATVPSAIETGLNAKAMRDFTPKPEFEAGHAPAAPVASMDEIPKDTRFNIPDISPLVGKGNFKTIENIGRREVPKQGVNVSRVDQLDLTKRITTLATQGQKGWLYKAADLLRAHPNVDFTETENFLQRADKAITSRGGKHNPERLAPALASRIKTDVEAARTSGEIERRVTNEITDVGVRANGSRLKVPEARLANRVARKFENEILGRGMAPGTGERLANAIAEGRNARYSGPQQARMWNEITSNLKFGNDLKFDKAVRILRSVEDYFITKGAKPFSSAKIGESVPLRLSQVAEAIGPQFLGKTHAFITGIMRGDPKALAHLTPDQLTKLRDLRAAEATSIAPAVNRGLDAARNVAEALAKAPMSVGRKSVNTSELIRNIKQFTSASGGGPVGAHVVGEYMGNILGKSDPVNAALHANRLKTEAWLAKAGSGKLGIANDPDFLKSVNAAITRASDLPSPAQLSGAIGAASKVKEWLGARFNAAYGVQDMREIYLIQQSSAMETTARRAALINQLGRKFNPNDADLWHEAFRTAQQNGISDGRIAELQSEISKVMENLFGGTGLRSGAIADSTVVGRNRILLDELNTNLKRFGLGQFTFSASKVKDAAGVEHDFSKGLDWMKSWEAWNVTKPYEFLHKVQNAIEFTVREKTMFDDMVSRFGSPRKFKDVKYGVNHPRLAGVFFTAEGASQAKTFVRMLDEVSTPSSKSLQYFDHVLSKLKASLTIYIPGHHMTNLIGDVYYNWIAGVNKPIRYEQAMKTMLSQKDRYGEFATLQNLTGPKALEQAVARSALKRVDPLELKRLGIKDPGIELPAGNKVIITMQNGTKLTADMIYTAAFREGILPSAKVLEDVTSDVGSVLDKFRPIGGRGQRAVHKVSEVRDHIPRLAQFIDSLAKHRGSFQEAVNSGARAVRKWHPDGLDLTTFERKVMKRVFPFYSWTRKAIPLAIESAIFSGPKVMAYPRLMEAIGLINGIDANQGTTDPFPNDQMFPDWLRNRGIGPVAGSAGSYLSVNPSTPVLDVLALMGNPGQSAIDMANPMGKVPIEVAQDQTLGRKVPINNYTDYAAQQIPVASQLGRASGQFGVSDSTKKEGFPNWINILNLLTGAKAVNTGKYQKSAQFDLRDYLRQKPEQQGR